jgi:hypothetical protein
MTHADLDLEELIDDLAYRYKRAPIGSAEERLILRELQGLLSQEMAQPFMEDHGIFMGRRPAGRAGPATICPMRRPRS